MCFPVNFAKILGTPFSGSFRNTSGELLLKMDILQNSCSTEYQADCMVKIFEQYQLRSSISVKLGLLGFVEDLPVVASKWITTDILFKVMTKERCEINPGEILP